jgi:hypothetical protein
MSRQMNEPKRIDWKKIKADYLAGLPRREIMKKYTVSYDTLDSRIKNEHWTDKRRKFDEKLTNKLTDKSIERSVNSEADEILKVRAQFGATAAAIGRKISSDFRLVSDPVKLKAMTGALKDCYEVYHKAKGIPDKIEHSTPDGQAFGIVIGLPAVVQEPSGADGT